MSRKKWNFALLQLLFASDTTSQKARESFVSGCFGFVKITSQKPCAKVVADFPAIRQLFLC